MAMAKLCCCFLLTGFAIVFIIVFFAAATPPRGKVHNILEDVIISNLSTRSNGDGTAALDCTILFKVWSRNANRLYAVSVWHTRIAAVYDGLELGRAYVLPQYVHPARNITHLEASFTASNIRLPLRTTSKLAQDMDAGSLPLRIYVKVRAKYKREDHSWRTKLAGGDLYSDDKCGFSVKLLNGTVAGSHLQGRQCGWTLAYYDPDSSN